MRLIDAKVRSRCACHSASATGSWVASVSVSAVAGRWRMPVPRSSRLRPSSRLGQRNRTRGTARQAPQREQAKPNGARDERQRQPQVRPRTPPETIRRCSIAAPDAASPAPRRSHILPAARPASAAAAKRHQARALALTGRGWRRSTNSPGSSKQHFSTTAAMRHPFRRGSPHPEIRITRRRDWPAATS